MTLSPQLRMDLRNAQSMVMTPQLSQAIALLQMNNIELAEYVEEQLAQNPFLEKNDNNTAVGGPVGDVDPIHLVQQPNDVRDAYSAAPEDNTPTDPTADEGVYREASDHAYDSDAYAGTGAGGRSDFGDDERSFDATLTKPISLRDHLLDQVATAFADPRDQALGSWLVDFLDEGGYLRQNPAELAINLQVDETRLAHVLGALKAFDPTGIFARDLGECLSLQLAEQGDLDEVYVILLQHLDILAAHDLKKLCRIWIYWPPMIPKNYAACAACRWMILRNASRISKP